MRREFWVTIFIVAFLFIPVFVSANVVINEICPTGCASADHQWVEIFNSDAIAIDLTGWKFWENSTRHGLTISSSSLKQSFSLEPNEYAVITQDDEMFCADHPGFSSLILDSSWSTLNKSGEEIGLKDGADIFMEQFTYPAITSFSIQRKDVSISTSEITNWCEHESGNTIGAVNVCTVEIETPTTTDQTPNPDNPTPTTTPTSTTQNTNNITQLRINEFVPNPSSGSEWIEIYNLATSSVMIDGLKLFDSIAERATPTGTIDGLGFFIVELSDKLNNDGDSIIIKDTYSTVIDSISYTNIEKGNSIARNIDGIGSFVETTTLTRGVANIITVPIVSIPTSGGGGGSSGGQQQTNYQQTETIQPGDVVINELVCDPADDLEEFVELYNKTNNNIDLSGWWIEDGGETKTNLDGIILAKGFLVVEKPGGSLNNDGDWVVLFAPSEKEIDRVAYGKWNDGNLANNAPATKDPMSLARREDGSDANNDLYDFLTTLIITKGTTNIIDSGSKKFAETDLAVVLPENFLVYLNELLPNPAGADTGNEFIEIFNSSTQSVDLKGWSLVDAGNKKHVIEKGEVLPMGYLSLKRSITKISLGNSGNETLRLLNPAGVLADIVEYSGTTGEDESLIRLSDNTWSWTTVLTPNAKNILVVKNNLPIVEISADTEAGVGEDFLFDASDSYDIDGDELKFVWDFGDGQKDIGEAVLHSYDKSGTFTVVLGVGDGKEVTQEKIKVKVLGNKQTAVNSGKETKTQTKTASVTKGSYWGLVGLDKMSEVSAGDKVKVSGTVAVLPNVFGSQYFYIATSTYGVQIYMNSKKFPSLRVGDVIEVTGEVSEPYGEKRVKVKNTTDIRMIGHTDSVLPAELTTTDLSESVGAFVKLKGEITDIKSTYLYIDDGEGEVKVAFKRGANIGKGGWKIGDLVEIVGIVGQSSSGIQLMPRSEMDIVKTGHVEDLLVSAGQADKDKTTETYLTATAGGLTSILISLAAKARGKVAFGFLKRVGGIAMLVARRRPKV